jgi:hypothetical protein
MNVFCVYYDNLFFVKKPTIVETIRLDYVGLDTYREWKKTEFQKEYYVWIWEQQDCEVGQEIDGKTRWEKMEE